jgi:hypothetical protein
MEKLLTVANGYAYVLDLGCPPANTDSCSVMRDIGFGAELVKQQRDLVLSKTGLDRVKIWIEQRLINPKFDYDGALMHGLKIDEHEARAIAEFLVDTPSGQAGSELRWPIHHERTISPLTQTSSKK